MSFNTLKSHQEARSHRQLNEIAKNKNLITKDYFKANISELSAKTTDIKTTLITDMIDVKAEVADVKNDVANVKNDVARVKDDVANVKNDVADVKNDIAEVRTKLADVKTELKIEVADVRAKTTSLKIEVDGIKWIVALHFTFSMTTLIEGSLFKEGTFAESIFKLALALFFMSFLIYIFFIKNKKLSPTS